MDQEFLKATGQHVLCILVAPITHAGHQDLALESLAHPTVSASGFPPVLFNFGLLVLDELLAPLFDSFGFHEGPNGSHCAGRRSLPPP